MRKPFPVPCGALLALVMALPVAGADKDKPPRLTDEQHIMLVRGLTAEYAKAKALIPRSKKALPFETDGKYDKAEWEKVGREYGPAARTGDLLQISKIDIEGDKIVLQINGGFRTGPKWYQRIEVGMGPTMTPVNQGQANAPGGTTIALLFHKPLPPLTTDEVKKMLSPILDFEKRTVTQTFVESLPPEQQTAVKEKRALVGMDKDTVLMALGRPVRKVRESKDGDETEDWVYGSAPGKIVFVTFSGNKVIKVKETYAGLGSEAEAPKPPV